MTTCERCDRPTYARGLCKRHYGRWQTSGDFTPARRPTLLERFWSRVTVTSAGECWEWTGGRRGTPSGPGHGHLITGPGRRMTGAHVLAWVLANGRDVPAGYVVRHRCDNPPCCNPAHLELGTAAENVWDTITRDRHPRMTEAGSACRRGHPFTPENTYTRPDTGTRICRTCQRLRESTRAPRHRRPLIPA